MSNNIFPISDNFQHVSSIEHIVEYQRDIDIIKCDVDFVNGYMSNIYQYRFGIQVCSTLAKSWKLSKKQ